MPLSMITFIEDVSVLSDKELLSYSVKLAQHEKEIGLQIIICLREAERRMLYCQLGMNSLWEFATQHLGLSSGNAQMKIDAMRLSRDNPIAQEKIKTGELSLVNAAKVNSFFRQEKKAGHIYTPEQKAEVIESVLDLSQSKCERALLARAPESIPAEKIRPLTETKTEVKIVVNQETMAILKRLKDLLSNRMPNATYADLLDYLAREKVEVLEKKQMGVTLEELECVSTATGEVTPANITSIKMEMEIEAGPPHNAPTPRKYISVEDRRWAMRRAGGQCEHVSSNGRRCTNRRQLQLDHKIPLALGGTNERSNYRIACRACNIFYAKMHLGEVMNKYVPSLN